MSVYEKLLSSKYMNVKSSSGKEFKLEYHGMVSGYHKITADVNKFTYTEDELKSYCNRLKEV